MKEQEKLKEKLQSYLIITIILLFAIHFSPHFPYKIPLLSGHRGFWENVFLGIFGSLSVGLVTSYIMFSVAQERELNILIRKIKWLENSILINMSELKQFRIANERIDKLMLELNIAIATNDLPKIEELEKKRLEEEDNIKILKIKAHYYRNEWLNIKSKARELKEDFGFAEFFTADNKDKINNIFQSLFNVEKRLENAYIYMGSNAKNSALATSIELCQCEYELKFCLKNLIEGCIPQKKQKFYKDAYIKDWEY